MTQVQEQSTKSVRIRPTIHQKIAIAAVLERREIKDIVETALAEYLAQRPTVISSPLPSN